MQAKVFVAVFIVSALVAAPAGLAQTCNNDTVVQATKAGLQPAMIIQAIKGQKCAFDTSLPALANLKNAGVSDEVITAMQNMSPQAAAPAANAIPTQQFGQPMVAGAAPGDVTIFAPNAEPQRLTRIDLGGVDTSKAVKKGVVSGLTLGVKGVFMKDKDNVVVPGESSDVSVKAAGGVYLVANGALVNSGSIAIFRAEAKKGSRIICKTKGRMASVDEVVGDKVPVTVTRDASGQAYRIEPQQALAPGEYGLILDKFAQFVWTFSVAKSEAKSH